VEKRFWRATAARRAGLGLALIVLLAAVLGTSQVFAQSNPGQQFAEQINSGDYTTAASWFSDDVVATGGFCDSMPGHRCVGKSALISALRQAVAEHTQINPVGGVQQFTTPDGRFQAITATSEIQDDVSRSAGIDRYISIHTTQFGGDGKATIVDDHLDVSDPETARFAAYLTAHPNAAGVPRRQAQRTPAPLILAGASLLLVAALAIAGCEIVLKRPFRG